MPSRTYYVQPRLSDYGAQLTAFEPNATVRANEFMALWRRPYIGSNEHLAYYLGINPALIRQILHNPKFHYSHFDIEKKNGETRKISSPRTYLKVIQWWIKDHILDTADVHDINHGFVRGRSCVTNAKVHFGANHIVNVDIKKFFENITELQVFEVFLFLGYDRDAANMLTQLTTLDGVTPTGAPTSPQLGNLVLKKIDERLIDITKQNGMVYSRFADDITISSKSRIDNQIISEISTILKQGNFELNSKKTKFMGRGDRMEVTGILVNRKLNIGHSWRNKARGMIHKATLNPEDYAEKKDFFVGLYGTLVAVDPERQRKLTQKAAALLEKFRLIGAR